MSSRELLQTWFIDEFTKREPLLGSGDTAWFFPERQRAMKSFATMGFPHKRLEDWKYTDVTPLLDRVYIAVPDVANENDSGSFIRRMAIPHFTGARVVVVDGRYVPTLSDLTSLPEGVTVMPFKEAMRDARDLIEQWMTTEPEHGFEALNTALSEDGVFVHVAKNVEWTAGLHCIYATTGKAGHYLVHPRNVFVVDEGAHVSLIEESVSLSDLFDGGTNTVSHMQIAANARVESVNIQRESDSSFHIGSTYVQQARDSHFTSHVFTYGGSFVRNGLEVILADEGSSCELNGLYLPREDHHIDNHTVIEHAKSHCRSREVYKGVMNDRSRGVFNGKIIVRPDAQQTEANQSNANLLLSERAKVDTKPQLEIFADDVKCRHGATVGAIDTDQLFYLRSRGIDQKSAHAILVSSFMDEVIQFIRDPHLCAYIRSGILERMGSTYLMEDAS